MLKHDLMFMFKYIIMAAAHFLPALAIGIIVGFVTGNTLVGWLAGIIVAALTSLVCKWLY
jgi:hypothetical protein